MAAPALFPAFRRRADEARHVDQVLGVEALLQVGVLAAPRRHGHGVERAFDGVDLACRRRQAAHVTENAETVPGQGAQPLLQRKGPSGDRAGTLQTGAGRVEPVPVDGRARPFRRVAGDRLPGDGPEHHRFGHPVAAEAVGAVDAAGILAGREQPFQGRAAVGVDADAAHLEVRRGGHLDQVGRHVDADGQAAGVHARGGLEQEVLPEMPDVEMDAGAGGAAPGPDLHHAAARDEIAGGALHLLGIVARHVAFAVGVEQVAAGAPQALLEDRPVEQRAVGDEARGVELHHLHVDELGAGPVGHGEAVSRFLERRRGDAVERGGPARRQQDGGGVNGDELAAVLVEQQRAGHPPARGVRQQVDAAHFVEQFDVADQNLFREASDDLDSGEVAAVDRPVERLSGQRPLVDGAVGAPVEEAAEGVLHLEDALRRLGDQGPGQLLIVYQAAAPDRVVVMPVERIVLVQDGVVAALDHAGAAALAEQALAGDDDVEAGRGVARVDRRIQRRSAAADDQHVTGHGLHVGLSGRLSGTGRAKGATGRRRGLTARSILSTRRRPFGRISPPVFTG